jgi:SpoVK/Ycf46/Vps4 family AAA+-type ATPase
VKPLCDLFDIPFKPGHTVTELVEAAHKVLDASKRETTSSEREQLVASMNGMFERLERWGKDALEQLKMEARAETMREMKGTPDSILWVQPGEFDAGTYVLDEKVGVRMAALAYQLERREVYVKRGIRAPTRLMFDGPPGTGKTMGAKWLAAKIGMPIGIVRADELGSHFVSMTAKNLAAAVKEAETRNGILFLDEIDGLFMRRDASGTGGSSEEFRRITTSFLQLLNNQPLWQIIICATNLPDRLDPAMLRRFPERVTFTPPDVEARKRIASNVLVNMRIDDEALALLVDRTDGASGDHVTNIAHKSASFAIDHGDDAAITCAHVRKALAEVPQPPTMNAQAVFGG